LQKNVEKNYVVEIRRAAKIVWIYTTSVRRAEKVYVEKCGCKNHGDLYNIVFGMEREKKIEAGLKRKLFGWYQKKKILVLAR